MPISFIWPAMLLLLLLVPLAMLFYLRMSRQRKRRLAALGSMGWAQQTGGRKLGTRRHIPPILFLLGLSLIAFALARPKTVLSLPRLAGTVLLTFDVSGSMAADDMKPTRMEAAKAAAREFVARQPSSVLIGVVAFSESGLSVQVPTSDKQAVLATINRLTPARGTSLANGIFSSLSVIEAMNADEARGFYSKNAAPAPTPTPVPRGTYGAAAIVLLSDGENNVQPDPLEAAQMAVDRGVRVHTVGVGSPSGATLKVEGFSIQTHLDEATLQQISKMTDGRYYNAQSAEDLRAIYENLNTQLIVKAEETEITAIIAGAGLVLLLVGGILSLLWLGRVA